MSHYKPQSEKTRKKISNTLKKYHKPKLIYRHRTAEDTGKYLKGSYLDMVLKAYGEREAQRWEKNYPNDITNYNEKNRQIKKKTKNLVGFDP